MSRDNFDGEQAPIRKVFSEFRKAQEQELGRMQSEGNRAKDALVDLCNQAMKFPAPRLFRTPHAMERNAGAAKKTKDEELRQMQKEMMMDEEDEDEDEEDEDEEDDPHLAFLKGPRRSAEMRPETAAIIPRSHGTVEMRRFVKLFTADRQPVVNRGTPVDRCRWAQTSTGLDLNLGRWEVVRSVLSQSMQPDEGRSERDSLRIVLKDVLSDWDVAPLGPQLVLNDAFVFQPFTVHAVGPINELRFLPGVANTGAFLLTEKAAPGHVPPQQVLGVGIGYVSPVNAVNTEFAPYRAAVGLNVFELHPHAGRFRTVLKLQAVFTPSQLGSVQVDWGFIAQYTPIPRRCIEFAVPVDRSGARFVHGAAFSRDGEPFSWRDDNGRLPDGTDVLGYTGEDDTVRSRMHAMLSRLPMIELAAKILMFRIPAEVKTDLFRMFTRHRAGLVGGGGDDWPVFATMPCVGPFLMQQLKLMYHAHLLKLAVYVLTMDCMRMSGVFGPDNADHLSARGVFGRALYVLVSPPLSAEELKELLLQEGEAGQQTAALKRNWGKMVQSVMHMWHTTLGTFPFGGSNQKFCTSEDYYKTVFGLESLLDALIKLHYILSCEGGDGVHAGGSRRYPRPRATIAEISEALKDEVRRRIHGDEEKLKLIRSKIIGEMTVGKPRFVEGKRPRRDPLDFLGIRDLIRTDATGDLRSASLQLPMSLKSVSVRFDLGRTLGRFLPYWRRLQSRYLPSGACFGISREDLRSFRVHGPKAKKRGGVRKGDDDDDEWCWSTNDCCATGECVDPLHVLNHALHKNAHARLRQLMNSHHDALSAEMSAEEELRAGDVAQQQQEEDDKEKEEGNEGRRKRSDAMRLHEERRSFLRDSVTMKEFNTEFLRGGGHGAGSEGGHHQRDRTEADELEEAQEGSVVELPLSVSGKVLKCVVNTSFVPSTTGSSFSSYPRPPRELPPSSSSFSSNSNMLAAENTALRYITGMVKLLASKQGLLPPPPERLAR